MRPGDRSRSRDRPEYDPDEYRAARVMSSLATDPRALEIEDAFEDAMDAVEVTGGVRKRRGGGQKGRTATTNAKAGEETPESASPDVVKSQLAAAAAKPGEEGKQEVVKVVAANQKTIAQMIGAKVEALKRVALPVSAVVGAATVLNRPTVYGNIARVAAEVFRSALNTSVQSTWGQWGEAFLDMGRAGGVIAGTLAEQTAQGPVVPFALATMYVAWDANRQGKTMTQLLLEYGSAVKTSATRLTKGQVDAFQAALKGETAATSARVLKEIAGRIDRPAGEGAQQLSAAFASLGAPAMGSTGMVPGRAAPSPASALGSLASASPDVIADNTEARKAAAALLSLADLPKSDIVESPAPGANAAAAPAAVMEDEAPPGGRRRRRKTRRRVPKRKRITRKMPIFVY